MKRWLSLALCLAITPAYGQGYPKYVAALSAPAVQIKAGKGVLTWLFCPVETATDFLQLFDTASAPTLGTTQPSAVMSWGTTSPLSPVFGDGMRFNNGLYAAITTTANGSTAGSPVGCVFGIK